MQPRNPVNVRLRQIALSQLDLAINYSPSTELNQDEAIHETRRCLKRVRALLRLVRAEIPEVIYDRDNMYLRNVGRQLSQLRDAAVVAETLARLQQEFPLQLSDKDWHALNNEVAPQKHLTSQVKKKQMAMVEKRLRTIRTRVEKWPMDFDDEVILQQALRRTYCRGRRAMRLAITQPSVENFHEWRKQVNHLRHQLRILQDLKTGKAKAALRKFIALAETLGLKNDLAVLANHLQQLDQRQGALVKPALLALISRRDEAFTKTAHKLGKQLFKPKSSAFVKKIRP